MTELNRREHDVEIALRLQKLEIGQEKLCGDLAANTAATKELLEAWKGSRWLLGLVRGGALLTIALGGAWAVLTKTGAVK